MREAVCRKGENLMDVAPARVLQHGARQSRVFRKGMVRLGMLTTFVEAGGEASWVRG